MRGSGSAPDRCSWSLSGLPGSVVSADGRFVYVANRLHNSIGFFSIDEAGKLALVGEEMDASQHEASLKGSRKRTRLARGSASR